jgi:hypothetical protein
MASKSEQLQIRVTRAEKVALKRLARRAGVDVSSYVLSQVLPPVRDRIGGILKTLRRDGKNRFALAELNDLLVGLTPAEFRHAVDGLETEGLSPFLRNYVAAMVELAAYQKNDTPPPWVREVEALDEPYFAVPFPNLRAHLVRTAPVAFKRRNIFVDSTLGDRV